MKGQDNDYGTMHAIPQSCPTPLCLSSKLQIPSNNVAAGKGCVPTSKGAKAAYLATTRDPPSAKYKNGSHVLSKDRRGRLVSIGEEPRVRFDPDLIKPKSNPTGKAAPIALRVCNKLLDRFPKGFKQYQMEAAIDSGATSNFVDDKYRGLDHQEVADGDAIEVECANTSAMISTSTDKLRLKKLSKYKGAGNCHKFPNMSTSLLSVKQFDDGGLVTMLCNKKATVFESRQELWRRVGIAQERQLLDIVTASVLVD